MEVEIRNKRIKAEGNDVLIRCRSSFGNVDICIALESLAQRVA